jgi:HSP20 family protein
MAIQRFNARTDDMSPASFSSMLDRFFNESLNVRKQIRDFTPSVDAYETEGSFEIEMALPGLKEDEVEVDFHDGRLTISGERRFQNEDKNKRYHMVESQYGSFSRSFQLPQNTNPENIEANFEDGVLHISVKKEEERSNRRQIQVKSQGKKAGGKQMQVSGGGEEKPTARANDSDGNAGKSEKEKSTKEKSMK